MGEQYYSVITNVGTEEFTKAIGEGKKVEIKEFAVGDGEGREYLPDPAMTQLKREVWRGNINSCKISEESENILIVDTVIPSDVGGFTIREMALFDTDGNMIAICNTPETPKVKITDGVVHEVSLEMEILLSNTDSVELVVDPNVVTATKKDLEEHAEKTVCDEAGIHGIRYFNNRIQIKSEDGEWGNAKTGGSGIAPSNMIKFAARGNNEKVYLYIQGPNDTVVDGQLLCTVAGVKIVRSYAGYPLTEDDGNEVIDIKKEDFSKYSENPFTDDGLMNGQTYYYSAFPYSDHECYNRDTANRASATPKMYELYGYDEDVTDINPATRIHYAADTDNASYSPITIDLTTGEYDLGNWKNAFFIKNTRPVMLKYDGTVDYELNHDDQTKKLDGTDSDVGNTAYEGNAMVEFPKMYFKRWQDLDGKHMRVSDQKVDDDYKCYQHMYDGNELDVIYLPMFEGCSINSKVRSIAGQTPMNTQTGATEKTQIETNGEGWQFDDWIDAQMITHLLFLVGQTKDLQSKFGNGHYTGGSSASNLLKTGTLKDKGMFFGSSGNVAVKFFWLENYYGDRWERKYGTVYGTDGHIKVKPYPPYNTDGTGYIDTGLTITGTNGGYISETAMTEYGEFPVEVNGSETTYQPDGCWFNTSQLNFLVWGGGCGNGLIVGAAFDVGEPFSRSAWHFGPSPAYKCPIAA